MFVRAIEAFETASHNVIKGALVDLPDDQARQAIASGVAIAVGTEAAIQSMTGVETATDQTATTKAKATAETIPQGPPHVDNNAEQQATGEPRRGQAPSWAKR